MVTTDNGAKVRFTHYYHFDVADPHTMDERGIPGRKGALKSTDVTIEWPDGTGTYGVSHRVITDNPDKAIGRSIALDRATSGLLPEDRKDVWRAVARTHKIRFPEGYRRHV